MASDKKKEKPDFNTQLCDVFTVKCTHCTFFALLTVKIRKLLNELNIMQFEENELFGSRQGKET